MWSYTTTVSPGMTYVEAQTHWGLPWWLSSEESACQRRRCGFNSWIEKTPWRREWQPPPVSLPGKSHRQRSLASYSPWGHKESRHDVGTNQHHHLNLLCFALFVIHRDYKILLFLTKVYIKQIYWHHFTDGLHSLRVSVSCFGTSCHISHFFMIILFVMVTCDQ